jgi:hypothetical protein
MSDSNIKTIKVNTPTTLSSPEPQVGGKRRRTRRRVTGGATLDGVNSNVPITPEKGLVQILKVTDTGATMNPIAKQAGGGPSNSGKSNIPPGPEISASGIKPVNAPVPSAVSSLQVAGSVKVVLKPKAHKRTKVLLKKKQSSQPVIVSKKKAGRPAATTRRLVVKSLSNKLKRTRHTIKHAKTLPIEQIKKILIEKKLIKPSSKAPESVLRQMYTDTLIVSKKML